MRINRFTLLITILLSASTVDAAIIYSIGETVEKVMELPQIDNFKIQASDGKWYDTKVGIMHEQFSLFWIPLINLERKGMCFIPIIRLEIMIIPMRI